MCEIVNYPLTPESSESSEDISLHRETTQQFRDVVAPDREIGQTTKRYLAMNSVEAETVDPTKKKESQDRPKRATGVHPTIRTTSTDGNIVTPPVPLQDDPGEDIPGEGDNPYHEISDDDYDAPEDV
ncbi:MAG: hypothetical protein BroJett018_32110 [Chloroflexota bacterium]|nr:MAG: hypothetical protein BroJett018_32110 [Chloroflexota bacterium]